ncbi:MAG: hypothetical protein GIW95_00945 [Candidatus Eremiobacteraeota bacterium]|nr:hypothetical protein [Candidatus Eremiobacteraeota bacterium]
MREHFFQKYFAYRRRYVEHIEREAPHRAHLAASSEVARLLFLAVASLLNALILWLLFLGTLANGISGWALFSGLAAAVMTVSAIAGLAGARDAWRERCRLAAAPSAAQ